MASEEGASSATCIAALHLGFGPTAWSEVDGPAIWLVAMFPLSFLPLDRLLIHVDSNYHRKRKQQEVAILRYNSCHLSISFWFVHQNAIKNMQGKTKQPLKPDAAAT